MATDSFNSSNQPRRGVNPFGDKSYSDSFVRASTAPLNQRRMTRPLQASPEMVEEKLRSVEEQLNLCRTIVDRFAARMKILRAAEAQAKAGGAPEPPPEPVAEAPEPEPAKPAKFGLGKKPFGRPGLKPGAKSPAKSAAPAAPAPSAGGPLPAQERAMAAAIADRLRQDADLLRRAQIALFQFDDAQRSVSDAGNRLEPIRQADPDQAWDLIEGLEVSKLQGKVYPICNFHEIFKRDPILSRVFPAPNTPGAGAAVPGAPGGSSLTSSGGTGRLGTGPLGSGPLGNRGFLGK